MVVSDINECIRASKDALELAKLIRELDVQTYGDAIKFLKLYTKENQRQDIIDFINELISEIENRFSTK